MQCNYWHSLITFLFRNSLTKDADISSTFAIGWLNHNFALSSVTAPFWKTPGSPPLNSLLLTVVPARKDRYSNVNGNTKMIYYVYYGLDYGGEIWICQQLVSHAGTFTRPAHEDGRALALTKYGIWIWFISPMALALWIGILLETISKRFRLQHKQRYNISHAYYDLITWCHIYWMLTIE